MKHIRPHQVLNIPDHMGDKVNFFMPPAYGGSPLVLESIMLIKLLKVVDPDQAFEFGTFTGITTRLMIENMSENPEIAQRIHTLDLPDTAGITFQGSDKIVAEKSIGFERAYKKSSKQHQINQIFQDSMTFDPKPLAYKIQFIFVDGNHHVDYATNDTQNAFTMLGGSPACIVWHDYGNPEYPELTAYLEELSLQKPLYHIEETMLAFYPVGFEVK
jgi:hypothetical protein